MNEIEFDAIQNGTDLLQNLSLKLTLLLIVLFNMEEKASFCQKDNDI